MKVRTAILAALVVAWLGGGAWALRYAAGGMFLGIHKTDPREVTATTWQEYWADYKEDPKEKKRLQGSMGAAAFAIFGLPLVLIVLALGKSRSLHGDARWAKPKEVSDAGLLTEDGLILGKLDGKFLMMNEPKFVSLIAPTRSGKGVGTIIPNLLNWNQSVIVVDIKGENFEVTSGFRAKHGQAVYKFAPFDESFETHCWNPLSYVSREPHLVVGDLQSIGYMLFPKSSDGEPWNDSARNLFVGVSLYCIESGYSVTIGEIYRRAGGNGRTKDFWQGVIDGGVSASGARLSKPCIDALSQITSISDNTLGSVLFTFNAPLGPFMNPAVDAATSRDDFDLRDIRRRKMSIYVVIPPNRLAEASLLINLFFSIAIDQNTKTLPEKDPGLKYLALLLLDEFPALGRVDKYVKSIGYIAGYGLRSLMIAQSMSQLKDRDLYGDEGARTLATNHMVQIVYAPREQQDAQEYSEILGYYGLNSTSKGTSRGRGSVTNSENVSEQKRALMLPQELREIGPDRVIVLSDNCKPIFGQKIKYYEDDAFKTRLLPAVRVTALDVKAFVATMGEQGRTAGGQQNQAEGNAIDLSTMPPVSDFANPIASEVTAMADWLFSNVQWTKPDPAEEPTEPTTVDADQRVDEDMESAR